MITVSENISLQPITKFDYKELYTLMKEVYPLSYQEFWNDDCSWYVNSQYSQENILKELNQQNAEYYFVIYNKQKVGNFRFIWDENLEGFPSIKTVKLHRIYLHQNTQGKGIGKTLLRWLENLAKQQNYELLWLDAMNKKEQAYQFYCKQGFQYHSHCYLEFELLKDPYRKMSQLYKKITP